MLIESELSDLPDVNYSKPYALDCEHLAGTIWKRFTVEVAVVVQIDYGDPEMALDACDDPETVSWMGLSLARTSIQHQPSAERGCYRPRTSSQACRA